jgi:hypothetical protein
MTNVPPFTFDEERVRRILDGEEPVPEGYAGLGFKVVEVKISDEGIGRADVTVVPFIRLPGSDQPFQEYNGTPLVVTNGGSFNLQFQLPYLIHLMKR